MLYFTFIREIRARLGAVARPRSQHELIRLKVCPSLTVIHFLAHADYQAVSSAGLAEAQRKTATQ